MLHQKPLQPHSSKVEVVAVSLLLQGILFHTHHPGRTINGDIIMTDMHFYLEKDFSILDSILYEISPKEILVPDDLYF